MLIWPVSFLAQRLSKCFVMLNRAAGSPSFVVSSNREDRRLSAIKEAIVRVVNYFAPLIHLAPE